MKSCVPVEFVDAVGRSCSSSIGLAAFTQGDRGTLYNDRSRT